MGTLHAHARSYLNHRVKLGEMSRDAAGDAWYTLSAFADVHGDRPLNQLGQRTVERWLYTIRDKRPATRRNYLSRVRMFCAWLIERGLIATDPTAKVGRIRQPRAVDRTLEPEIVAAMLEAAPDLRGRAILMVLYGCGTRCIEVSRLCVEDWHRRDRTLLLHGKGGHERVVPVPEPVHNLLVTYVTWAGATGGPMFRSYLNPAQGLSAKTISHYVRAWARAAGVKHAPYDGVSAHALRHSFANEVLDVCGDVRIVQELLGHANVATTSRYLGRARLDEMRAAVDARKLDEVMLRHPSGREMRAAPAA